MRRKVLHADLPGEYAKVPSEPRAGVWRHISSPFFISNPSPQVGKLNAHKTDTVAELMLLHPADRLMVHLIKIPRLEARVTGLLYRARFEERISLFEEAVEQTTEASVALQEAPKFRQLLSVRVLLLL